FGILLHRTIGKLHLDHYRNILSERGPAEVHRYKGRNTPPPPGQPVGVYYRRRAKDGKGEGDFGVRNGELGMRKTVCVVISALRSSEMVCWRSMPLENQAMRSVAGGAVRWSSMRGGAPPVINHLMVKGQGEPITPSRRTEMTTLRSPRVCASTLSTL